MQVSGLSRNTHAVDEQTEREGEARDQLITYGVLHGVGGDDIGIIGVGVGGEAIGEEADADVPFYEEMAAAVFFSSPDPSDPDPRLPVSLLESKSSYYFHALLRHEH